MKERINDIFSVATTYEQKSEPHDVITRLRLSKPVGEREATRLMEWLIYQTRSVLTRALDQEPGPSRDIRHDPLHGRCSFSQCVASYALKDRGLSPRPFSAQSLRGYHVGHAMATLNVPTDSGTETYLIDPTFKQFCDPERPLTEDGKPMPGYILAGTKSGQGIVKALLADGYLKVTPEIAHEYLASFCLGKPPFESPERSLAYMRSPVYDNAFEFFSRESMQRGGYLIPRAERSP